MYSLENCTISKTANLFALQLTDIFMVKFLYHGFFRKEWTDFNFGNFLFDKAMWAILKYVCKFFH